MPDRGSPPLPLLGALCALPPLSIDMGLPSLPAAGTALGVGTSQVALTVTLFMAGFALSPIVYGALSDRWGRRPMMIVGLSLFALGGLSCILAPSLEWLLAARLVQGAGAGCGPTLAFAATRDRLDGARLGQRLALLTMLLNTAPVIAPSLGTACLVLGGWRGVYVVLAAGGVSLLFLASVVFRETHAPSPGSTGVLSALRRDGVILLGRRDAVLPGLAYGLSAGSMFAYVSTSPLLLMQSLGASPTLYAGLFALTGGGIVLGALLSGRALREVAPAMLVSVGLVLSAAGPAAAAALMGAGVGVMPEIVACMVVATFGYGLIAPAAAHAALDAVPEMAGTASALMNSMQMTCMALSSLVASLLFRSMGDLAPPSVMMGFAIASAVCLHGWRKKA